MANTSNLLQGWQFNQQCQCSADTSGSVTNKSVHNKEKEKSSLKHVCQVLINVLIVFMLMSCGFRNLIPFSWKIYI